MKHLVQAEKLGAIIGKKPTEFGLEVFKMRGGDNDLSVEELCTHDSKEFKKVYENLYTAFLRQTRSRRFSISA